MERENRLHSEKSLQQAVVSNSKARQAMAVLKLMNSDNSAAPKARPPPKLGN
jgi:hypothetical protein